MSPAYQGPPTRRPIDSKIEDILTRTANIYRGDGKWLCGLGVECGFHLHCREDGSASPRVEKELPNVTTERGEVGRLYCTCHNCEQRRRRTTKRPRWTPES